MQSNFISSGGHLSTTCRYVWPGRPGFIFLGPRFSPSPLRSDRPNTPIKPTLGWMGLLQHFHLAMEWPRRKADNPFLCLMLGASLLRWLSVGEAIKQVAWSGIFLRCLFWISVTVSTMVIEMSRVFFNTHTDTQFQAYAVLKKKKNKIKFFKHAPNFSLLVWKCSESSWSSGLHLDSTVYEYLVDRMYTQFQRASCPSRCEDTHQSISQIYVSRPSRWVLNMWWSFLSFYLVFVLPVLVIFSFARVTERFQQHYYKGL